MDPVAPPLSMSDQPERCIEQLLSIISQRDAQISLLQTQLLQQTELCNLHAARAARAEADAAAARTHVHNQLLGDPAAWPPCLSPADLAALNAFPAAERDAAWLRRVFVRGRANPPVGPYEVAGLYVDAFFWSGTAARPDAIVAAVARAFPGVELVPTECGPRFRGLARAQAAPAPAPLAQMPMAHVVSFGPAAEPPPSSRPASAPGYAPFPATASTSKRKQSPEASLLQPEFTSKRVRSGPAHSAPAPAVKPEFGQSDAGDGCALDDTLRPGPVTAQDGSQWGGSTATQPAVVGNLPAEAAIREPQPGHEPPGVPHAPPSGQPLNVNTGPPARDVREAQR